MSTYNDNLTLQVRQLTQEDYDRLGGEMLLCRAYMSPTTYSFVPGDFWCQRMVGERRDAWILPHDIFATEGWFAVSPPDDAGFVVYGGLRTTEVMDMDNGFLTVVRDAWWTMTRFGRPTRSPQHRKGKGDI